MNQLPNTSRRQFLATTSAALAAASVAPYALAEEAPKKKQLPIIDCHQHLWDLSKFKLPWIKEGTLLGRNYVMDDYNKAIEGTGISHAVYMEVDVDPSQQKMEVDHLSEICESKKTPTIAAVVSGRPAADDFTTYLDYFKEKSVIRGVRQVLHGGGTPGGYCLSKEFVRGIHALGERGLSFDLCMRPSDLGDGAKLATECKGTRFIVDHCGNADPKWFATAGEGKTSADGAKIEQWRSDLGKLARLPNVVCKISGIIASVPKEWSSDDLAPVINQCLEEFGPERVIVGSDWPVCLNGASLADWIKSLREIVASRPVAEQERLFSKNAIALYQLKL